MHLQRNDCEQAMPQCQTWSSLNLDSKDLLHCAVQSSLQTDSVGVQMHVPACVCQSVCLNMIRCQRIALASRGCISSLLSLQGLQWLHERGRAFCDLKPENIRVQMGRQPGTFAHVTLVDLGGSVKFKGESPTHSNCLAYLCMLCALVRLAIALQPHFLSSLLFECHILCLLYEPLACAALTCRRSCLFIGAHCSFFVSCSSHSS